jgi:hypothetical protein
MWVTVIATGIKDSRPTRPAPTFGRAGGDELEPPSFLTDL